MKSMPRWFLIPPAVAALLILGTLSMQGPASTRGEATPPPATTAEPVTTRTATNTTRRDAPPLPRTPDLMQTVSALIGVLLLGAGGVALLRRLRGTAQAPRGATLLTLRQTMRLSPRQALHAIEFDDRLLLVGESERGLSLLDSGKLPERAADEAEVLARSPHAAAAAPAGEGDLDDGAVPKDLVIPRPPATAARRLPTPPATPARTDEARPAMGLADFRNLLQKVGRA